MSTRKLIIVISLVALAIAVAWYATNSHTRGIVLTGIVTTDEVIVSPEIQGRLQELLVKEGDVVTNGELLALIQPQERQADVAFYAKNQQQSAAQVTQAEADLENARLVLQREETLYHQDVESEQAYDLARTTYDAAKARVDSLARQTQAAEAQQTKAAVQLGYTTIYSPRDGVVDTRSARQGEVLNPGQPIVTLIDPDDLWVRADVEETYIDRIHLGDKLAVTLPSGARREGTVFFRGVDADYATQRDVSRTKRDIKTFEIRLRCDNRDRSLAVGMTAFVMLPLGHP
jgi:RND family efflux transporter MFP subunit